MFVNYFMIAVLFAYCHHLEVRLAAYEFGHICDIKPLQSDGACAVFMPQHRYRNALNLPLSKYGAGPFCKFRIPNHLHVSGVYAVAVDGELKYVGECADLSSRYNAGYGNISPRNCFKGGQDTNCRLNNLICLADMTGLCISLWFYQTSQYKAVEAGLRSALRPVWNRI